MDHAATVADCNQATEFGIVASLSHKLQPLVRSNAGVMQGHERISRDRVPLIDWKGVKLSVHDHCLMFGKIAGNGWRVIDLDQ
jgi:hypothetical protein